MHYKLGQHINNIQTRKSLTIYYLFKHHIDGRMESTNINYN